MRWLIPLAAGLIFVLGCGQQPLSQPQTGNRALVGASHLQPAVIKAIHARHLPNAIRIHEKVISGGLPGNDQAFEELKALGVKTVISVDGAKPDVATAQRFGMRYVHLPHGYDGVPDEQAKQLAKAVRDLPFPIYIHCHHGKHRSPAAASVACVGAGLLSDKDALRVLKLAGTSPSYRGLYESASRARSLDAALLDALEADFPSVAHLPALAEAMVALEETHDHLKQLSANHWRPIATQVDLEPVHEALLLREHFTELLRMPEVEKRPEKFQILMHEGETTARELEESLEAWHKAGQPKEGAAKVDVILQSISKNCVACHKQFRDVPLSEKRSGQAALPVAR